MRKLKKEIARLETNMFLDDANIDIQYRTLKESMNVKTYITLGIIGSFILGFIIVRERKPTKIMRRLANMALAANRAYNNVKFFL
jgi:hypothetical protein